MATHLRDCIRDSNDLEILRRLHPIFMPDWLMPNVRLKQQHFLPKQIALVATEQEYQVYIHTIGDKMEVYWFVKKLFEEHNACAPLYKYKEMHIESSYLFCMDAAESSMSSSFFMYIPKWYYRRFLDDVPLLFSTKVCIIIDYHRRLAYRFGLSINKMTEDIDAHSEDRSSVAESGMDRSVLSRSITSFGMRKRAGEEFLMEGQHKELSPKDIMITNRLVNMKRNDNPV